MGMASCEIDTTDVIINIFERLHLKTVLLSLDNGISSMNGILLNGFNGGISNNQIYINDNKYLEMVLSLSNICRVEINSIDNLSSDVTVTFSNDTKIYLSLI